MMSWLAFVYFCRPRQTTKTSRVKVKKLQIIVLSALLLGLGSCKQGHTDVKEQEKSIAQEESRELTETETIAYKNGFEHWADVSQIDFTFNVDRNGQKVSERSWSWKPKQNEIELRTATDTVNYNRSTLDSLSMRVDRGFINDKYWLLAPFQLVWDEGTTITVQDTATAPISQKLLKKLTLVYSNEGGYTPGDAYDFYYGSDFIIQEWAFRQANAPQASLINTFEDYEDFNGIKIAKQHKNKDASFNLYFSNIKVTK